MLSTAVDLFGDIIGLIIMISNQLTHSLSSQG
jgi:ABC-type polysaccharide transport system permease subunit